MSKNSGYAYLIIDGKFKDHRAIAYARKQEFLDINKICVTIYEGRYEKVIKENVLISEDKLKLVGFVD